MPLFGKKTPFHCAICGKELKHRYKPHEEWDIDGYLCGNCHIEKTKEFILKQQEKEQEPDRCAVCKKELADNKKKPRWQWNMESGSLLCSGCYEKLEAEYIKKLNFCSLCNKKLGLFHYNPKPAWQLKGKLCRECWDRQNAAAKIK